MKIASKLGSVLAVLLISGAVAAQPGPGDVFAGKKVTILVGSAAGGGYDAQARLMSRHLGRHIPGAPGVIVQNVPGAGGLVVELSADLGQLCGALRAVTAKNPAGAL